ncbi:MAG: S-adenosylmethionine:tRNA ribosyltransferase-isomerase [Ilumatobacteraceae bacterium]
MTTSTLPRPGLDFDLPAELSARQPAEATPGAMRTDVRLMVSDGDRAPTHRSFADIARVLRAGDLLVVNTSAAMAAAIDGRTTRGEAVVVHVSTELPSSLWLVEVRTPIDGGSTAPDHSDRIGETVALAGGAEVRLLTRFEGSERLWVARLDLPGGTPVDRHLARHGRPIRYPYVERDWPLDAYQTVFGRIAGSAEMPSASRPFTDEVVTDLVTNGVSIAPLLLHSGVSSLESRESPYPERFEVGATTARLVNHTRADGGRVIAVGTTVVRALESVVDDRGLVHPGQGWTDVIVTPERGATSVDGLLTGWHEPEASHLLMLEAVAAPGALAAAYGEALAARYRWHEFGDVHLILR